MKGKTLMQQHDIDAYRSIQDGTRFRATLKALLEKAFPVFEFNVTKRETGMSRQVRVHFVCSDHDLALTVRAWLKPWQFRYTKRFVGSICPGTVGIAEGAGWQIEIDHDRFPFFRIYRKIIGVVPDMKKVVQGELFEGRPISQRRTVKLECRHLALNPWKEKLAKTLFCYQCSMIETEQAENERQQALAILSVLSNTRM